MMLSLAIVSLFVIIAGAYVSAIHKLNSTRKELARLARCNRMLFEEITGKTLDEWEDESEQERSHDESEISPGAVTSSGYAFEPVPGAGGN